MATNPYYTQLHTQRFSFIGSPQQRDGLYQTDQRFLNMYPELIKSPISDGKKYYLKKRPGISTLVTQTGATGVGRGVFWWNNATWSVVGNTLYVGANPLFTMSTSTGTCGFCVFTFETGGEQLIFTDGMNIWAITTTLSFALLSGYPVPHLPYPIFLDGYLFVAQANSPTIWGSNVNDPTTWPPDNFINAEMYADNIQMLTKNMNYLVAVGEESVEFFYDNANATGSPLQRNAPAVSQLGTPAPDSVNQTEKEIIMIGQTAAGGKTVWVIDGFQPKEIANEPIREALDTEGATINIAKSYTIQCAGHKWYVMNLFGTNRTFVYDFEEQMWHEWTSFLVQSVFRCLYAADSGSGYPILQDNSTGHLYELSPYNYSDDGNAINCVVTTTKVDFDTVKRKRLNRLSIIGDNPIPGGATTMQVQFSDDDYATWTPARDLILQSYYSTITVGGIFRRRAFRFTYTQPFPLRMEAFELDVIQEVRR